MAQRVPGTGVSDPDDGPLIWEALRWAYLRFGKVHGAYSDFYDAYQRMRPADGSRIEELIRAWVWLGVSESEARAYVQQQRERLDSPGMREVLRSHIEGFPRRLLEPMYRRRDSDSHA